MKLTAADRKGLRKSVFGEPGKRAYPMPDKSHAIDAKGRATQQVAKGNLSAATAKKIDAKANKIIKRGK